MLPIQLLYFYRAFQSLKSEKEIFPFMYANENYFAWRAELWKVAAIVRFPEDFMENS